MSPSAAKRKRCPSDATSSLVEKEPLKGVVKLDNPLGLPSDNGPGLAERVKRFRRSTVAGGSY
jgi:hypothetical protein